MLRHLLLSGLLAVPAALNAQTLYFPPNGSPTWDTLSPATLGWCPDRIDSLVNFVGSRNSKALLILKDGKIVLEHYYGTFTQDSLWYWASAGKTLTAMLTGIAQEEGYLDIDDASSTYLGTGWTSATPLQEAQIAVRDQLTMTSGLDDGLGDTDCTDPSCLQYLADPGTRWAYHNAPYSLLDDVIANATGSNFNSYFNSRIRNPIGMDGFWFPAGYNNVYYSKPRSMARYGLLALNGGVWNTDTILHDASYFTDMTTPSQGSNESYGYLWWLNGQPSFMVPSVQFVFPGMLMPDAPADMICGLGKNDQLLNVVPGQNLVVVRMGNEAYGPQSVAIVLNNEIWQYINQLTCTTGVADALVQPTTLMAFPNPSTDQVTITLPTTANWSDLRLTDALGREMRVQRNGAALDLGALPVGSYMLRLVGSPEHTRLVKQ